MPLLRPAIQNWSNAPLAATRQPFVRSCNRTIAGSTGSPAEFLRNDSEAEDVVQETYVRAFTHLDSFRGDFKPRDMAGAHRHE